jgi:hypothetical protein
MRGRQGRKEREKERGREGATEGNRGSEIEGEGVRVRGGREKEERRRKGERGCKITPCLSR